MPSAAARAAAAAAAADPGPLVVRVPGVPSKAGDPSSEDGAGKFLYSFSRGRLWHILSGPRLGLWIIN